MKIVFATANPHKLEEINEISKGSGIEFILPPAGFSPIENGSTFEENSFIKARDANRLSGMISLADDSGLCVEALDGAPGLYSARYAGTQTEKIQKLIDELKFSSNRNAKFVCVMTLLDSSGKLLYVSRGECEGSISKEQSGDNGFGYDPLFIVGDTKTTMAEMSEEEKNKISHRGKAFSGIVAYLKTHFL